MSGFRPDILDANFEVLVTMPFRIMGVLAFLGVAVLSMPGCATSPAKQLTLCPQCRNPDHFVKFQSPPWGTGRNARIQFRHPFQLEPEAWARLLSEVRVQGSRPAFIFFANKTEIISAFTGEEIDYLSQVLSRAFAQVPKDKWVVFGLSRRLSPMVIQVTTGGLYVEGNAVHLMLSNFCQPVSLPTVLEGMRKNPLDSSAASAYYFVPGPHQKVEASRSFLETGLFKDDPPNLAIDYASLLKGSQTAPEAGPAAARPGASSPRASPEERLLTIDRLKKEGTITEEEYQSKRRQILDEF